MSDGSNRPYPDPTCGALNLPEGRTDISMLEYLTGHRPPLDLAVIQTVLQELQLSSDLQDDAAAEIRLVWSECRLPDNHRTHEQVLKHAKDLASQAANALSVPGRVGRLPRAALIAAYGKTRPTDTGAA